MKGARVRFRPSAPGNSSGGPKALEAELGMKLFNRERQRLVITEGRGKYLTVLRDAFDRITVGTERLVQRQSAGVLTVSTSPDFAAKWLAHRLDSFKQPRPPQTAPGSSRRSL